MSVESTGIFTAFGYPGVIVLALVILLATYTIAHVVVRIVNKALLHATDGDVGGSIIKNIIRVVVWALGISLILQFCFGINPSVIWGALGIGGIAVSFGLQNTISNLIGGLQLSLSRDVGVGDWIVIGTNPPARVVDINWRVTKLEDENGVKAIVPNSVLNSTSVQVLTQANVLLFDLALAREANVDELKSKIERIAFDALGQAGMRFEEKMPVLSMLGTTVDSKSTRLKVFADREYTSTQVNNAFMPQVLAYLDEQGALAHCYSG